ncbi:MAG: DNA translocase FtsK, partial [Candidatus Thermoplasmatota archaeon]|nr:DNA translocase FtsK [Candidatus Thermoplasmatota archaeon]
VNIEVGPVVIQYQLELAAGTKVHKVMALSDDLAMALKTPSVRIVAPIPGKSAVGIEVPNKKRAIVRMREIFEAPSFNRKRYQIPLFLGKDCSGNAIFADLTDMPHLLLAGATGSGKTVCLNTIRLGMLMTQYPKDLKLLLVDPKMVEMASFKDIPHLINPVVTNMKKAPTVLAWAATKMDERYDLLAEAGVRSIVGYNALGPKEIVKRSDRELPGHLPYIVIMIDELADLMSVATKEVEMSITRLAQKSRAVGIHIVLATQRPSVDVITGLIKSNLPARISFRVTSKIDSRTILDRNGAEKLLGQGDLLMLPPGSTDMIRAQGTYVSDAEVRAVVEFIKAQAEPEYYEDLADWDEEREFEESRDDPLYNDAIKVIVETQRGSASLLQRRLEIGYTRASRFVDMMEEDGIVGGHREAQSRKVLLTLEEWEQKNASL